MGTLAAGEVVIVHFPFSDLTAYKLATSAVHQSGRLRVVIAVYGKVNSQHRALRAPAAPVPNTVAHNRVRL